MKALAKTRTIGGSLAVTIPIELVKTEMLQEGQIVEIEITKRKRNSFGALKGIGKFTEEDRMKDRE